MGGEGTSSGPRRRGSRSVRSAVQAAIDAADLTPADHALAAVALQLAGQLDKAGRVAPVPRVGAGSQGSRDETPAERARRRADVVALSRELRAVLGDLPLRGPRGGGGGDDDDDHAAPSSAAIGDPDAELAGIVGAGATLGDAPLS